MMILVSMSVILRSWNTLPFVFLCFITAKHYMPWIGVADGLTILPQWDTSVDNADYCFVYWEEENTTISFYGNPVGTCTLQLSTKFATTIQIPGNLTENNVLYIEDTEPTEDCPNRIIAFRGQHLQCYFPIPYKNIRVNMQGNASIVIAEMSNLEGTGCAIIADNLTSDGNQTMPRCTAESYDSVQKCDDQYSPICTFMFPPSCNAALMYRGVVLNCKTESGSFQERKLIVYPNHMHTLNLNGRNVVEIDADTFRNLGHIKMLWLGVNRIKPLHPGVFDGLHNLIYLSLKQNYLGSIESGLFNDLKSLSILNLRGNALKTLPPDLFLNLASLTDLYLGWNSLQLLDPSQFQALYKLEFLAFGINQLAILPETIFDNLIGLHTLQLDVNRFQNLNKNWFQNLTNLVVLDFTYNELRSLDAGVFDYLINLGKLYLIGNQLGSLDVQVFQHLQLLLELHLRGNKIHFLHVNTFTGLNNLRALGLAENNLTSLPSGLFEELYQLQVLGLEDNRLRSLPLVIFNGKTTLRSLYLDNNKLESLETSLFKDLKNVEKLIVDGNNLKRIDFDIFINTPNLAVLDLSDNELETVPNLGGLQNLFLVNLKGNDLRGVSTREFATINKTGMYLFVKQHEICECYVPLGVNCSASSVRSPFLTCYRLLSDRVLVTIMWLIGLNALGGNAFVLFSNSKHKSKNKVQTFLCSNLALSDFLMGLYMIIVAIADVYYGESFPLLAEGWRTGVVCKIAGALAIISSESSVFFVTLISIDRLISVKYSRSRAKLDRNSVKITAAVVWTLSIILGSVPSFLAGTNPNFYDNSHVCIGLPLTLYEYYTTLSVFKNFYRYRLLSIEISRSFPSGHRVGMYFSTVVFLGVNCACYVLIVLCYASIIRTVYVSSKRAGLNSEMKTQIRFTLKVAAIVITDFMCWFPVILLGILVQAEALTLPPSVFAWAVTFVLPINSAINPYLYTIADVISSRRKENLERRTQNETQSRKLTLDHGTLNTNVAHSSGDQETASGNQAEQRKKHVSDLPPSYNGSMSLPNVPEHENVAESNV